MKITAHQSLSRRVVIKLKDIDELGLVPGNEYGLIIHPYEGQPSCERIFGRDMKRVIEYCANNGFQMSRVLIAPHGHYEMIKHRRS